MIKAVIFDFGGVLIDYPVTQMFEYYARTLNIGTDLFKDVFSKYETSWFKGEISENKFWGGIAKSLQTEEPKTDSLWLRGFQKAYKKKEQVFSLLPQLKAKGLKLAILSNTETPVMEFIKKQSFNEFDLFVFSCEIGMRKPDKNIYEYTLQELNINAQEALFVDDMKENTDAAERIGLQAIYFTTAGELREKITRLGINL